MDTFDPTLTLLKSFDTSKDTYMGKVKNVFYGLFMLIIVFPPAALASRRPGPPPTAAITFMLATREPLSTSALVGKPRVQRHVVISRSRRNDTTCRATRKPPFNSHPGPANTSMWDERYFYGTGENAFFQQSLVSLESHLIRWRETMRPTQNPVLGRYNLAMENSCTQLMLLTTSEWKHQTIICTIHSWTRLRRSYAVVAMAEAALDFERYAVFTAQNKWRMEESLGDFHCGDEEYCLPAEYVYNIENAAKQARRTADDIFGRLIWTHFNPSPEELN